MLFFKRRKPRFVPVRRLSVEQSLDLQVKQEIGPVDEDKPFPADRALMLRRKYGLLDPAFRSPQLTIIRAGEMQSVPPRLQEIPLERAA